MAKIREHIANTSLVFLCIVPYVCMCVCSVLCMCHVCMQCVMRAELQTTSSNQTLSGQYADEFVFIRKYCQDKYKKCMLD